jgi:flagellar biosynthesis protein FlhB
MLVLNDFLNGLYDFLNFDRVLMDNILTTFLYLIYIYICIKNGTNWISLLIGYLIISTVLQFLGISSYLNIISILEMLLTSIIDIIFAPAQNFLDGIKEFFEGFKWW